MDLSRREFLQASAATAVAAATPMVLAGVGSASTFAPNVRLDVTYRVDRLAYQYLLLISDREDWYVMELVDDKELDDGRTTEREIVDRLWQQYEALQYRMAA